LGDKFRALLEQLDALDKALANDGRTLTVALSKGRLVTVREVTFRPNPRLAIVEEEAPANLPMAERATAVEGAVA